MKEDSYFLSGYSVEQFSFSFEQQASDDLLEQDEAQHPSLLAALEVELSAFTSVVSLLSLLFLSPSFFGSLSKFTISTELEEAIKCCTPTAPNATNETIAIARNNFFIFLNVKVKSKGKFNFRKPAALLSSC
jgi:hypothetical protein